MDPRIERARQIVECEAAAVRQVADGLGEPFLRALDLILGLRGRVVTTGMGKAGFIAQKTSATLASTGTPSIFLHPAEAIHGDLGRVDENDLLLAFSKSGETEELMVMLPHVKSCGATLVAITQERGSTLGRHSDLVLELGRIDEAGPHGLAPSASTTAMLALGDALALVVQEGRNFGPEDFARFHPGGERAHAWRAGEASGEGRDGGVAPARPSAPPAARRAASSRSASRRACSTSAR